MIRTKKFKIGVVGLGYVGLPIARTLAEKYDVIGFDINEGKIKELRRGYDQTGQFSKKALSLDTLHFFTDETKLSACDYLIVTVPTPLTKANEPNLSFLKDATSTIGKNLSRKTTVIFESTVYPGTTEEICIPILETESQLVAGKDFYVGYSPERINPGDEEHVFKNTPKIVAGQNKEALQKVVSLYQKVIEANLHEAPSIKVAEAAKILENTQRDVNIALMNEFSLICHKLNINTLDVIAAAKTKWNFTPFTPGLVGGHCISIDPYYLIYKAKRAGYHPQLLSSARQINDSISSYIVSSLLALVVSHKLDVKQLKVALLGVTFKENIPDTRNSKALDILRQLQELGISIEAIDPYADKQELARKYKIDIKRKLTEIHQVDVVILAVPHQDFNLNEITSQLKPNKTTILMDIKGIISNEDLPDNIILWHL
ncbi:nucleotide sugar dehydrogenase [Virgibacillus soli]|uniref:nucleotide sugar dehydrogenase n=1 Tax=Paracerasibacillus soli TaxID=480284 RepID=UPI0035EEAFFF